MKYISYSFFFSSLVGLPSKISDDTIVVFMSDNGAISREDAVSATQPYPEGTYMWDTYQQGLFNWNAKFWSITVLILKI